MKTNQDTVIYRIKANQKKGDAMIFIKIVTDENGNEIKLVSKNPPKEAWKPKNS
jgi:hypothetical protein